jgi:hypothetical protein
LGLFMRMFLSSEFISGKKEEKETET